MTLKEFNPNFFLNSAAAGYGDYEIGFVNITQDVWLRQRTGPIQSIDLSVSENGYLKTFCWHLALPDDTIWIAQEQAL